MERTVRSPDAWEGSPRAVSALVKLGLSVLRSLLMARPQVPLRVDGTLSPESKSVNDFVEGAEEHFTEKLWTYGPPDGDLPDLGKCLRELLKSEDTVSGGQATTVRPYCPEKLSLLTGNHTMVDLEELLDQEAQSFAREPDRYILLEEKDIKDPESSETYVDPAAGTAMYSLILS